MNSRNRFFKLLMPAPTKKRIGRLILVALTAYLFFAYLCLPLKLQGHSMAPTYRDGTFNFCWRLRFLFSDPAPGDVVVVRMAGKRVMLLKRVVAVAGQTVAFRHGRLVIDGRVVKEPYVQKASNWNLPSRKVKPAHVYLVGDNRQVAMDRHDFGQAPLHRIMGAPLW